MSYEGYDESGYGEGGIVVGGKYRTSTRKTKASAKKQFIHKLVKKGYTKRGATMLFTKEEKIKKINHNPRGYVLGSKAKVAKKAPKARKPRTTKAKVAKKAPKARKPRTANPWIMFVKKYPSSKYRLPMETQKGFISRLAESYRNGTSPADGHFTITKPLPPLPAPRVMRGYTGTQTKNPKTYNSWQNLAFQQGFTGTPAEKRAEYKRYLKRWSTNYTGLGD